MKVKELIEILKTFDQDMEVMTEYEGGNCELEPEDIRQTENEGKQIVLIY